MRHHRPSSLISFHSPTQTTATPPIETTLATNERTALIDAAKIRQGANARASWRVSADNLHKNLAHCTPEKKELLVWSFLWCIDRGIFLDDFAAQVGYDPKTVDKIITGAYRDPRSQALTTSLTSSPMPSASSANSSMPLPSSEISTSSSPPPSSASGPAAISPANPKPPYSFTELLISVKHGHSNTTPSRTTTEPLPWSASHHPPDSAAWSAPSPQR